MRRSRSQTGVILGLQVSGANSYDVGHEQGWVRTQLFREYVTKVSLAKTAESWSDGSFKSKSTVMRSGSGRSRCPKCRPTGVGCNPMDVAPRIGKKDTGCRLRLQWVQFHVTTDAQSIGSCSSCVCLPVLCLCVYIFCQIGCAHEIWLRVK